MNAVTAPAPSVQVSPPHIVVDAVEVAHGQRFNGCALTLEQARALHALLGRGIDEYVNTYGDGHA